MQALLLAAGRGTRFGANKLLHPLPDGTPLALAAARNLQAALPEVLVVVSDAEPRLIELLSQAGLDVSVCPTAGEGMGASLAWGVRQTSDAEGWLIALADMPWINPRTIRAVASAVRSASDIAAPLYAGQRGHPVALGRAHGPALMALSGDQGARALLAAHAHSLRLLDCTDAGVLRDVDRREQLES